MSLKDYVTLGRSGLRVSPLTLGTMIFGTESALCNYHWPGNIRELQNVLERAGSCLRGPC